MQDETSPWGQIISISKKSLVEKKVLALEEKARNFFSVRRYKFNAISLSDYGTDLEKVKAALVAFEKSDLADPVAQAIRAGMSARQETSSSSDD